MCKCLKCVKKFKMCYLFVSILNAMIWKRIAQILQLCWFNTGNGFRHMLLSFNDFFWRSVLLEYWRLLYVWGHCFGCSLLPWTPHPECWCHLSFRGTWPYQFRSNKGAVVPIFMLVNLQPIPDAEYLPFYWWEQS